MAKGEVKIGLWGGSASGKTTFLAAMCLAGYSSDWKVTGLDASSKEFLKNEGMSLQRGQYPPETVASMQLRFQVSDVERSLFGRRVNFTLFAEDRPGADFIEQHPDDDMWMELASCDGLVYLFDPRIEQQAASTNPFDPTSSNGSSGYGNFTYLAYSAQCIESAARKQGRLERERLPQNVAVCLTKFDHPAVMTRLLQADLVEPPPDPTTGMCSEPPYVRRNLAKDAIEQFSNDDSVSVLERHFRRERVQYFATSSVGFGGSRNGSVNPIRMTNSRPPQPVSPINVLEPLVWLYEQALKRSRRFRMLNV